MGVGRRPGLGGGGGAGRGEARHSLKLTRGPRRGYKNVRKQPTGLSKEVRGGPSWRTGAGWGGGADPTLW